MVDSSVSSDRAGYSCETSSGYSVQASEVQVLLLPTKKAIYQCTDRNQALNSEDLDLAAALDIPGSLTAFRTLILAAATLGT